MFGIRDSSGDIPLIFDGPTLFLIIGQAYQLTQTKIIFIILQNVLTVYKCLVISAEIQFLSI